MRRGFKVFLGVLGVGVLVVGGGFLYRVNTSKSDVPGDLIATKSAEVSEEDGADGGDPKSVDLKGDVSDFEDDSGEDYSNVLYDEVSVEERSNGKIKKLDNGNYSVNGKEMTEEEFENYLFENRKPLNVIHTDEENSALLKEAEISYNKVSASDGEIYSNFITNYKNFKSDMSTDNYNLLKESLGSVEISLGYGK